MDTLKKIINWINYVGGFRDEEYQFEVRPKDPIDSHIDRVGIDEPNLN